MSVYKTMTASIVQMNYVLRSLFVLPFVILFTSCEHQVATKTTVHEDGSLDKTIIFEKKDSVNEGKNYLGLSAKNGWAKTIQNSPTNTAENKEKDSLITMKKTFSTVDEANAELATPNDTLFRMTSKFEKSFRWFYTYIDYSDTYHSLNRMKLSGDDYFSPEDFAFIDRLPAEGKIISKADSVYLKNLNDKIYDQYGMRAYFQEYYDILLDLVKQEPAAASWTDYLIKNKESVYQKVTTGEDIPDDFILLLADSLKIPLKNARTSELYITRSKLLKRKTEFISWASEGKYTHSIEMPWTVISSNADSVINNQLFWKPTAVKFLLKDYTMHAKARKLNLWALVVSGIVIAFTVFLFLRRRI
jgi:hypothetical protein